MNALIRYLLVVPLGIEPRSCSYLELIRCINPPHYHCAKGPKLVRQLWTDKANSAGIFGRLDEIRTRKSAASKAARCTNFHVPPALNFYFYYHASQFDDDNLDTRIVDSQFCYPSIYHSDDQYLKSTINYFHTHHTCTELHVLSDAFLSAKPAKDLTFGACCSSSSFEYKIGASCENQTHDHAVPRR